MKIFDNNPLMCYINSVKDKFSSTQIAVCVCKYENDKEMVKNA